MKPTKAKAAGRPFHQHESIFSSIKLPTYDRHVLIQRRAYLLWEVAGKPAGKSLDFWLTAEKIVDREYSLPPIKR